ncbi:MAG: hypothetical protein ACP5RT_02145 [Candidatus Micrarchaeia archaeon]
MEEKISIPVAYSCSSSGDKEELISCAKKIKKYGFVQLFANNKKIAERLLPAYFNALIRIEDNIMRSSSLATELLLLVSGQMNISKAIKEVGIKNNDFILFATSEEEAKLFVDCSKSKILKKLNLEFATKESPNVAVSELLYG